VDNTTVLKLHHVLYCIFIDKTAGNRKYKQAGILVQHGQNIQTPFSRNFENVT